MSLKKPLVITNGQIEQLQAGDTIAAAPSLISKLNDNAGSIVIGQPVYSKSATEVDLAQADASGTKDVIGLVYDTTVATTDPANIITDGVMTATTGQWDVVTGDTGGLTFNTIYYLDPNTPGMLTSTAPTVDGDFVAPVGIALSTTQLEIRIKTTVKL